MRWPPSPCLVRALAMHVCPPSLAACTHGEDPPLHGCCTARASRAHAQAGLASEGCCLARCSHGRTLNPKQTLSMGAQAWRGAARSGAAASRGTAARRCSPRSTAPGTATCCAGSRRAASALPCWLAHMQLRGSGLLFSHMSWVAHPCCPRVAARKADRRESHIGRVLIKRC